LPLTRNGVTMGEGAPIQLPVSAAQPGDILWSASHVGISLGGNQYIHAPSTGDVVRIANNALTHFLGCGRWY
jgi:cell wall-associated NlpC family hydrolase